MLERKVYSKLLEWKGRDHKCLVVSGQRQVGKTYIIEAFGKAEYEHYVYLNFNDDPSLNRLFDDSLTATELIKRLSLRFGSDSIVDGSTLIFLDEIQECPRAYSSLKQFTIYGGLDVIASGSLLGVELPGQSESNRPLIPLGYEETLRMHPLDFEEFLWAMDIPRDSIEEIRSCIRDRTPLDGFLLERITDLYRHFLIIGGMPEAVDSYVSTRDFRPVSAIMESIVSRCVRDINRYNQGIDRLKTMECFESIPRQLAETNKKFMYSRISNEPSRKSADRYKENLLWIKDAGYGNFCYGLQQPALPIVRYIKPDVFKIYFSDTGLLLHMYGDKARSAVFNGDEGYNMGAIIENSVAESLFKNGCNLCFYRQDKGVGRMELDFVLEFWDGVAVIEVKSGKDREARSLRSVSNHFDIARRIILENGNIFVDDEGVEHYPIFAATFIKEMDGVKSTFSF